MYKFLIIFFISVSLQSQSWDKINTTFTPEGVSAHLKGFFIDSLNGWCANEYLYKTTNGGIDWNKINLGTGSEIYDVNFYTENFGICQEWGSKYRTSDGGINWYSAEFLPSPVLDIDFIDSLRGITGYNSIYYTTDGGSSWGESSYSFDDSLAIENFQLLENGTGWAFAGTIEPHGGAVLKSTDFGKSWNKVLETENQVVNGYFINKMHGIVIEIAWQAKAYITRDGGETWTVCADSLVNPTVVYLLNDELGWICSSGVIYETQDGGSSWNVEQLFPEMWAQDIFTRIQFTGDKKHGYLFGSNTSHLDRRIYKYNGNVTDIEETAPLPVGFELKQNYPNPCNPSTTIEYSIHTPAYGFPSRESLSHINGRKTRGVFVKLRVYDILGRLVTTLVNEEKLPGRYSVQFDASSVGRQLSSGVYYYTLTAGDFYSVKKLMLVK